MNITRTVITERDRALLGGDYAAYHKQATRRIHGLRRRLGVATPRGRKYTPKAPVTAENVASNSKWVALLIASSERSWASAMSMKTSQATENTQKPVPGSTKRQIVSRLRKAIIYAESLVNVLKEQNASKNSGNDILEATAYLSLLKGTLGFEKQKWDHCLQHYSVAKIVYTVLGSDSKYDLFKDLLSGTVDPIIRYAAYQMKVPRTKPLEEIAKENFPPGEAETRNNLLQIDSNAFAEQKSSDTASLRTGVTTISWRSRTVKVEDAAISQALASSIEQEHALSAKMKDYREGIITATALASAYDDVINARQEAVDATKTAIDELTAEGVPGSDARIQGLQVTRTAVNYAVIEWRIGRNRILCGAGDGLTLNSESRHPSRKSKNDSARSDQKEEKRSHKLTRLRRRAALYDSILQSVDSVKELPGVVADEAFVEELNQKRSYFRSLKCLNVGRSHGINGSTVMALALYARALELSQQASTLQDRTVESETENPTKFGLEAGDLDRSKTFLQGLVTQTQALVELNNLRSVKTSSQSSQHDKFRQPLAERLHLNRYEEDVDLSNLVNFPPRLRPVPVKPLFFDIAWNYVQYPGKPATSEGRGIANGGSAADDKTEAPQPAKRGWFGFGR